MVIPSPGWDSCANRATTRQANNNLQSAKSDKFLHILGESPVTG